MSDSHFEHTWQTLPNPFFKTTDPSEVITGRVSGRSADIAFIVTGVQSAIILMGTPQIGKSTLIRYLQRPPEAEWSWRNELPALGDRLHATYFVPIDLTLLEGIESLDELLTSFIARCIGALQSLYIEKQRPFSADLKGLREFLSKAQREMPDARYFFMLDSIEHLGKPGKEPRSLERVRIQQEDGLERLEHSGAIHTLVDFIDDFRNFGVILSVQSLPRPKISNQFAHISANLARFTNMTLQSFTWEDTEKFLAQPPENFGCDWANSFRKLGGSDIFSKAEQKWIREAAGTHPYLLHQYCLYTFRSKLELARLNRKWGELDQRAKNSLTERMYERLSMFLDLVWKRLKKALETSSKGIENNFYDFISLLAQKEASDELDIATWDQLGSELRYILYSEGIVRYNQYQPIHFPGFNLRDYLVQKAKETRDQLSNPLPPPTPQPVRGYWLRITCPEEPEDRLSLTDLEYRLLKILIEHGGHSTETDLMMGGWEKLVDRSTFSQRMHHLRKKLKDQCGGQTIIENHYGGLYSLNHPEWFHLE